MNDGGRTCPASGHRVRSQSSRGEVSPRRGPAFSIRLAETPVAASPTSKARSWASIPARGNIIYSNAIGDSYPNMGLMKLGLGTLSLYGANSYGGGTAIQNGTLAVSTTLPLPAGTVVTLGDAANDSGSSCWGTVLTNGIRRWPDCTRREAAPATVCPTVAREWPR